MNIQSSRSHAILLVPILAFCAFLAGCNGGSKAPSPPPVPMVENLNNATTPSGRVGLPVEINGTGFQSSPGQVVFTQGNVSATVTPSDAAWNNSLVRAVVPAGNGSNQFTVPGTISVSVQTTGGTSNAIDLNVIPTVDFDVRAITWTTTTPLPTVLSGLGAVAVPANGTTSAWVVITGGYNGSVNTDNVYSDIIQTDGRLGSSWTATATQALPVPLAHHAMAEADPGNSPVAVGTRYLYVLGGQQVSTSQPGGVATVYATQFDPDTGRVGNWLQLPNDLPQPLIGPAVALFNGYIYVVGGLTQSQAPSANIYTAKVQPDGTLGPWFTAANPYPVPVAFATAFGHAGNLYVLGGDSQNSNSPNVSGFGGITDVQLAPAVNGIVGPWFSTNPTIKGRAKHVTWLAFGQVIDAEGVYQGNPGDLVMEHTVINADNSVAPWVGITGSSNVPPDNVFNAAAILSPILSSTGAPRFLLLGGEIFTLQQLGTLSDQVYFNQTP